MMKLFQIKKVQNPMSFSATYLPKYILRNLSEIAPLPGREREHQSHQIQTSVTIV